AARARGLLRARRAWDPAALAAADAELDRAARRTVQHEQDARRVRRGPVSPRAPGSARATASCLMLYDPQLHEPLTERRWDEAWVRERIAALVADADAAYDEHSFWPAHEWDAWDAPQPLTDLYCGASGVLWGLDELGSSLDLRAAAARVLERFREAPDSLMSMPL